MILESFQVGEGQRPTVLLHGFLGTGRNLRSLALAWSQVDKDRRFLLPDLTGHGSSPPLPPGATLSTVAGDVLETARAAGLQGPLDLVGHSLGGRVSLAASLRSPGDVARVTLLDITPSPIPSSQSESGKVLEILRAAPASAPDRKTMRAELTGRGLSGPLSDWLIMNLEPAPEGGVRWRFDRESLGEFHGRVNGEDLWAAVTRPGAKVRCIRGGRAHYVTDADLARMESLGCPVVTLPDAGHFVHVDAPDALLRWLTQG
ncbi:alpha/beta fold hydrolase [Vitiosangium sp. GDMCC 1.1324]|uniref:alpha/beta fold hydrolase n=1 Tax=Vitiosangium sp. (strain GDMCC 1.1324) TaxID=2138576 RepID=UPI000D340571|nr:alpha/beta hydrolase [Vitiosangium sp. GDMCC 1.1324]PTL81665.1 alpha/beta hydrolase [Vitiosangium sp. GDMCC 1.1324]